MCVKADEVLASGVQTYGGALKNIKMFREATLYFFRPNT